MARERRANDLGSFHARWAFNCASHGHCRGFVVLGGRSRICRGLRGTFLFVTPAAAATTERDFIEDDVKAAVKKAVDERTKDGAFVFRDPKLNAD